MKAERLPSKLHIDPLTDASYLYISNINEASHTAHCHDFFEVMLVVNGQCCHIINGKKQVISDGHLIFIRPDDMHCFEKLDSYQCQFINIPFSISTFDSLCNYLDEGFPKERLIRVEDPPYAELSSVEKSILRQRFELLNLIPISQKKLVKLELRALLVHILTSYIAPTLPILTNDIPQWFEELCLSMNNKENFTEGIEAMIKLSGKSHEHLCRLFKKYYSTTPTNYLNHLRLNYCANMLTNSDLGILDISIEAGYESLSYFYNLFKKKFGSSPSLFRKQHSRVKSII